MSGVRQGDCMLVVPPGAGGERVVLVESGGEAFAGDAARAGRVPAGEDQRQYFRTVARRGEHVALADRRCLCQDRRATVMAELAAA